MSTRYFSPIVFALMLLSLSTPVAQAATKKLDLYNPRKHYGDEKVAINDPDSRCTTAVFQKLHNDAVAQAQKDFQAKGGVNGGEKLQAAFAVYQKDIALGWDAMQEPYCGFGAFGSSAAQKSFQKTLSRARTAFLSGTNSIAAVKTTTVALTAQVPAATTTETVPSPKPVAQPVVTAPVAVTTPHAVVSLVLTHNLERNMRSEEVKALQNILVDKGYLETDYATGFFGAMTESAVIKFQLAKGLISSKTAVGAGFVGPRTRAELMR